MSEVLFKYKKRPPQDFIDLMIKHLNDFHAVTNFQWDDTAIAFVADTCAPRVGQWWETFMALREGLYAGYAAGVNDKNKPWSFRYEQLDLRAEYKGKTEKEVYEMLELNYYRDNLPNGKIYKVTRVTAKAATEHEIRKIWFDLNDSNDQFPLKHTMPRDDAPVFQYNPAEDFSIEPIW